MLWFILAKPGKVNLGNKTMEICRGYKNIEIHSILQGHRVHISLKHFKVKVIQESMMVYIVIRRFHSTNHYLQEAEDAAKKTI